MRLRRRRHYDARDIARETIRHIGYDDSAYGFDCNTCAVVTAIDKQSSNISQGVTEGEGLFHEQGAGDQGMMFGFACRESEELMPLPIMLAHKLVRRTSDVRRNGALDYLRPDSKSQVSIRYEDGKPVAIDNVVISAQHSEEVGLDQIREDIVREVIRPILPEDMTTEDTKFYVNPTGLFVIGGPMSDTGLTGPENHRGYLWGIQQARRWRIFRKGPLQGGPLSRLYGAIYRQKYRCGRTCR